MRKKEKASSPKKRARFERDYQEEKLAEEGAKVRALWLVFGSLLAENFINFSRNLQL